MTHVNNLIITKLNTLKENFYNEVSEHYNRIVELAKGIQMTDLKLHQASYALFKHVESGILSDEQSTRLFQHMCELEYEHFEKWEKENLTYVKREYIGRTSSFFYNADWCGEYIDNSVLDDLLTGKQFNLIDVMGNLDAEIYDWLIGEIDINEVVSVIYNNLEQRNELSEMTIQEIENEISDYLLDSENILTDAIDDLTTVELIVQDALKGYDYLNEYKTIENEEQTLEQYLEHEIQEYYADEITQEYMEMICTEHAPLSKIINITPSIESKNGHWMMIITSNNNVTECVLCKDENELTKLFADSVLHGLLNELSKTFVL